MSSTQKELSTTFDAKMQNGTVLLPGCVLDKNIGVTIAHDSRVKSHSFISPCVSIAGFTEVGECCNIGINSTTIDNLVIYNDIQIGGGTVVIKNLLEAGIYVGCPARFLRTI
jgi:UDP-3-O-[3-hydroxymyristoyl] glucosamine N-acyltransferase